VQASRSRGVVVLALATIGCHARDPAPRDDLHAAARSPVAPKAASSMPPPTSPSVALSLGFARLRWGMTKQDVRVSYPQTRTTALYESRDPRTGELVRFGGEDLILEIHRAGPLAFNAVLGASDAGKLVKIELSPDVAPSLSDGPQATLAQLVAASTALLHQLGVDPVAKLDELESERTWVLDGTSVTVDPEDRLSVTLSRP
jgi:hypothetical protein